MMPLLLPLPLLLPALLACTGGEPLPPSTLTVIDGGAGERLDLTDGAGSEVVPLTVRMLNAYGAAVPGGLVGLSVETPGANLVDVDLYLDAEGYAVAELRASAPGSYTVRVTSSEDGAEIGDTATALALGGPLPDLALDRTFPPPAALGDGVRLARGTGGVAIADASQVIWQPASPGGTAYPVLTPDFEIAGLRTAQVDADGVADLVVWGGGQVVLLRGRPDGGYSWGAGWDGGDQQVIGASVADVDGDTLADLVVGLSGEESATLELLHGDGLWGFQAVPPMSVDHRITALVAADEDADGRPDITTVDPDTGWLRRYSRADGEWIGGSPPVLDNYSFGADATLVPPVDLDADGVLDLVGVSGPGSGSQDVAFYASRNGWEKYEQAYPRIQLATADVDQDGDTDLLLVDDGLLHRIFWDQDSERFIVRSTGGVALDGPTTAGDLDGDGVIDLAILEDGVVVQSGLLTADGWTIGSPSLTGLISAVDGPIALQDIDGDGDQDAIGFVRQDGQPAMRSWEQRSDGTFQTWGTEPLNATGDVKGMVHCAPDWYLLVDNADEGADLEDKAFRMRLDASTSYAPYKLHGGRVQGEHIACGYWDNTDNRRFVVVDEAGDYVVYAYNVTDIDSGSLGGPVRSVALADPDGDGLDDLVTCTTEGCTVLAEDLDGDGADEVLTVDGTLTVDGWGQSLPTTVGGVPALSDADGDGILDIVLWDAALGRISLVPTLAGTIAPPVAWSLDEEPDGPVHMADIDGDGSAEAVFLLTGGTIVGTQGSAGR